MQPVLALGSMPGQSKDDAEERLSDNFVRPWNDRLDLIRDGSGEEQIVGIRFPNIGIPQGVTILSAHVQFTARIDNSEETYLDIRVEDSDDAAIFELDSPSRVSDRALTSRIVDWTPEEWTEGLAGDNERTPNLAGLIQDIVDRPDWIAGNALAIIIRGTGRRVAWSFDGDPSRAPRLVIEYQVPIPPINLALQVCHSDMTNIDYDCENRVENTLNGMAGRCNYPTDCDCTATANFEEFDHSCSYECLEVLLADDCSNFDPAVGNITATNDEGDTPVCTANSPLAASLYGRRSTCEVEGAVEVDFGGYTPEDQPGAAGVIEIIGDPCPGEECPVGMSYRLDLDPITFKKAWEEATFENLAALGGSLAGSEAVLTPAGDGTFGPESTEFSARGTVGGDSQAYVGLNAHDLDLSVDWGPDSPSCTLTGDLSGIVADPEISRCESAGPSADTICESDDDCEDDPACSDEICNCEPVTEEADMSVEAALAGDIVNQPPTANAGDGQVVECNLPGRARFTLDGSESSDPDDNIVLYSWLHGSRVGPAVGFQPMSTVEQPLDTGYAYMLRVIDAFGQADEDWTQASVEDTTAPDLTCPSDLTIECDESTEPSNTGSASAEDICDPAPAITYLDTAVVPGECPEEFSITRSWTATDGSENSVSCDQTIEVVDSTGPVIACNAPATITPPDAPISLTATATDNCDGEPSVVITEFACSEQKVRGKEKEIDKEESCIVEVAGDTINILDSGGVNDTIRWTVHATDNCGNLSMTQCTVMVVKPTRP
jgi:hypothetical protein